MAVAFATVCDVMATGAPVYRPVAERSERINTTATSAQLTMTMVANRFVRITASGGGVCILFGSNPTAVSGQGWHIPDGGAADFGPFQGGEKIALIDA